MLMRVMTGERVVGLQMMTKRKLLGLLIVGTAIPAGSGGAGSGRCSSNLRIVGDRGVQSGKRGYRRGLRIVE
jgi:hypothetical protein